jgi:hypothetical protein
MPTPSRKSEIARAAVSAFTGRKTCPILPVTEAAMAAFDYGSVAELFPTRSEAELFPTRHRRLRREPVGYGRFARAADAIRFAIEELPAELLPEACLEVDEQIFDRDGIRRLGVQPCSLLAADRGGAPTVRSAWVKGQDT